MSRITYNEDGEMWAMIRWAGAAKQAINGKRGQSVLREIEAALLAMPHKRLAYHDLCSPTGDVCIIGALAQARGFGRLDLEIAQDRYDMGRRADVRWRNGKFNPDAVLPEPEPGVDSTWDWAEKHLGITHTLAWELVEKNDEAYGGRAVTPEERYEGVLAWVRKHLKVTA